MTKKHHISAEHFMEQFHNHHHYEEHGPNEQRPEWWELPEPRKRGGRVDFKNGGRVGYADGGGIGQLLQNLKGSFGQLNQQVAAAPQQQAPAGGDYKAMLERATQPSLSPDYQAMVNKALAPSGKTYEEMFPANVKPYTPAASALTPIATSQPSYGDAAATDYSSWMTQIMGDGGSGAGTGDGAAGGGSSGGAAGADGAGGDGGASSAGGGSAYRYGGQTSRRLNIVERALAVTRRK